MIKEDLTAGEHHFLIDTRGKSSFTVELRPQAVPAVQSLTAASTVQPILIGTYRDTARVRTTVQTGTVLVGGRPAAQLQAGYAELTSLPPGKHELTIQHPEGTLRRVLEITSRPILAVYISANRHLGYLVARLKGADDAHVRIDGRDWGMASKGFFGASLAPKQYTIEIAKPGYVTQSRTLHITEGVPAELEIALPAAAGQTPVPPPPRSPTTTVTRHGRLDVDVLPKEAQVFYARAGEPQQRCSSTCRVRVPQGEYVVEARASGYKTQTRIVQVKPDEVTSLPITLSLATAAGSIHPDQWDGAWVHENGWYVREAPGFILYREPFWGTVRFTVRTRLPDAQSPLPRVRIVTNVINAQSYSLLELGGNEYDFTTFVNGSFAHGRKQSVRNLGPQYSVLLRLHERRSSVYINDMLIDEFGGGSGRFGFFVKEKDKIYISDFAIDPE
jgi:hypothetical protein